MSNKSKSRSNAFLIGLFVMSGVLVVIATIIWLGANQFLKERVFYVTYFESSIEGMEKGSPVKFQGVPCGRVAEINIKKGGLVEIVMQIDPNVHITDDMRVNLALSGIAGGKFLQLHYPSPEMSAIHPNIGDIKPPFHYIKSSPSSLEEISIAAQKVFNNLMELKIGRISDQTLDFLSTTTGFFKSDTMKNIMNNIMMASARLESVLIQVDTAKFINNIEASSVSLFQAAQKLITITDNIGKQTENTFSKMNETMTKANNLIDNLNYKAENSIMSLQETFIELKKTNKEIQNALMIISDNPSSVILSKPPKKEK